MAKYIIKESHLRSAIKKVVAEELNNALNEGLGHALYSGLKNTAKAAALATLAPGFFATKALKKSNDIINGQKTLTDTAKEFFGANDRTSSSKLRTDKRNKKMQSLRDENLVARAYGRPNTTSRLIGNRDKLERKVAFNTSSFGNLGRHYADIDGVWDGKLEEAEDDLAAHPNLRRRLTKQLKGWLTQRDEVYEDLIKNY